MLLVASDLAGSSVFIVGRTGRHAALDHLRSGDTFVVWSLDRLGRSLPHLIDVVRHLGDRGIQFRSLTESIDTTTPSGELLFHLSASFAHFERRIISERTRAGLAAARAKGRVGGRPTVMTPDKIAAVHLMLNAGTGQTQTARALGVSRASVRRALGLR